MEIYISYQASSEAKRNHFTATGEVAGKWQQVKVDAGLLTPAERQIIAPRLNETTATLNVFKPYGQEWEAPEVYANTPEGAKALIATYGAAKTAYDQKQAAEAQKTKEREAKERAEKIEKARAFINAAQRWAAGESVAQAPGFDVHLRPEFGRYSPASGWQDLPEVADEIRAVEAACQSRFAEIAAAEREREARQKAEAEAAKQKFESERLEWIKQYGSDHLQRAVAAGYNCLRKYVEERAALEFPGFEVDFDDKADWSSRSCPSEAALDIAEQYSEQGAEVVWLKEPANPREYCYPDEFESCEAVLIPKFLGRYDLLRIV